MTTTFFLVRHAAHDLLDRKLAGRMPGVKLSKRGRAQAALLGRRLASEHLDLVQSSPRERARETAEAIAAETGLSCDTAAALDEIDLGEWTGASFDELRADPRWRAWNDSRGQTRAPGGETMAEAQSRIVGHIERLCASYPERRIALVSHGDVIKSAMLHVLGTPLDHHTRIEIDPPSLSVIVMGGWGAKLVTMNEGCRA